MSMKRRRIEVQEMDITPMIDIIFQLIIFFMVAMSIAMVYGISIKFPPNVKSNAKSKQSNEKRLMVYMSADHFDSKHNIIRDGELKLNGEIIPLGYAAQNTPEGKKEFLEQRRRGFDYLRQKMRHLIQKKGYKKDILSINGDMITYHEKIMTIVDQGKASGIKGFSLSPPFK